MAKGTRLLLGGRLHALGRTFFEPTILADVNAKMRVASEETFGPMTPLVPLPHGRRSARHGERHQVLKGNADVMISESVETLVQQKLHPGLCAVNPNQPLQYGEMAYLLPRGDTGMKAWVDTWLHLAKASDEYTRIVDKWLE